MTDRLTSSFLGVKYFHQVDEAVEPTKQDAEAMLAGAGGIESAVRARAPREHPVYLWAGLTLVPSG